MTRFFWLGAYAVTLHLLWLASSLRCNRLVDWVCWLHVPVVRGCYSRVDAQISTIVLGERIRKWWGVER
jgi:hypothetical protein